MKRTYESFSELADCMIDGDTMLHCFNCAYSRREDKDFYKDPCIAWQKGVQDLAGWLDHIGVKVKITDGPDGFYDYMRDISNDDKLNNKAKSKEG